MFVNKPGKEVPCKVRSFETFFRRQAITLSWKLFLLLADISLSR